MKMSKLSPEEQTSLDLFMKRFRKLLDSPINKIEKQKLTTGFAASEAKGWPIERTAHIFPERYFLAFATAMRQMIMPKEQVNFDKICSILLTHSDKT